MPCPNPPPSSPVPRPPGSTAPNRAARARRRARPAPRNALKHGLTAQAFALLPGEDPQAYQGLLDGLVRRYRPADEFAAHLVQRLASVMWRQQRSDRLEAEVLSQLEQRHDPSYIGGYVPSAPMPGTPPASPPCSVSRPASTAPSSGCSTSSTG